MTIHSTVFNHLTAPTHTDRVIRLSRLMGRASDHRSSQAESGFRADHRSRVDLQHVKRYRVHVCVSVSKYEHSFHNISLISLKHQQGQRCKGEVDHRYGVEPGPRWHRESVAYGSGQEQRGKGFRISIVVIGHALPLTPTLKRYHHHVYIFFFLRIDLSRATRRISRIVA